MANVNPTQNGLAFSSGGIRSAAFCSGVLRRLLERNVEVDYLSCVSGGGYTGTAFLDWKYREERIHSSNEKDTEDQENWHDKFFENMEDRAGYFCNWHNPLVGILDTVTILGLILLVNFIGLITSRGSYACSIAFMIDMMFGEYLRDKRDCDDVVAAKSSHNHIPQANKNATIQELRQSCKGTPGSGRIILFSVLFLLTAIFFILSKKFLRRYSTPLSFGCATFGSFLVLTFVPFALRDVVRDIPHWSQYLALAVGIFVWFFLPLLRNVTIHVLMVYFFSYVIYWRVYASPVLGVVYSDELFLRLLFASGFVLWIVPLVNALCSRLTHVYNS